jgi:hypothetical protein
VVFVLYVWWWTIVFCLYDFPLLHGSVFMACCSYVWHCWLCLCCILCPLCVLWISCNFIKHETGISHYKLEELWEDQYMLLVCLSFQNFLIS